MTNIHDFKKALTMTEEGLEAAQVVLSSCPHVSVKPWYKIGDNNAYCRMTCRYVTRDEYKDGHQFTHHNLEVSASTQDECFCRLARKIQQLKDTQINESNE